jgi:small acid-soluble spore protein D (minor alpha/beta-type SASP)
MSKNYRKSRLMHPESYDAMQKFKMECATDIGRLQYCKENNDHYKGELTAKQNGSEGGPIGGEMVKRMIASYEQGLQ